MERERRGWPRRVGVCACAALLAGLVGVPRARALVVTRALRPPVDAGVFYGWAVAAADNRVMVGAPDDTSSGAAGALYLFDATTSALLSTLHSPTPATDVLFGFPVVALGSNVVVSDFLDGTGAAGAGAVHVFATATGTLVGTLQNDPPAAAEAFGAALAPIGTDILVTVPAGGVAYRLDPLTGTVVATFTAPSGRSFDDGPIAAAGGTVAVGAVDGSGDRSVLLYDGLTGALVETLTSPPPADGVFGDALAGFGGDVLVGEPQAGGTGAVYLFDTATGSVLRTFDNPDPSSTAFRQALAVLGSLVIVGDPSANDNAGAIYVFDGATGDVLQTLTSPDPTQPFFGIALAPFGTSVAVGGNPGVVYLLTPCGDGTVDPGEACDDANTTSGDGCSATCEVESYFAVRTLVPPVPEAGSFFGAAVAAAGDHVVVGAPLATLGGTAHGAAYLFDATTGALLTTVESPTPATDALFGFPVVALDGQVIASDFADDTGAADAGAVHVFDADTGALIRTLQHAVPTAYDTYGYSIAAAGDDVLVVRPAAGEAYRVDPVTGTVGTTFVAPVGLSFVLFPDSPPFPAQAPAAAAGDVVALTTSAVGTPSAVQVYDGLTGALLRTLVRPNPTGDVNFGFALAGVGADLLVDAPKGAGKGRVYRFDGTTGALVRTFTAPYPAGSRHGSRAIWGAGLRRSDRAMDEQGSFPIRGRAQSIPLRGRRSSKSHRRHRGRPDADRCILLWVDTYPSGGHSSDAVTATPRAHRPGVRLRSVQGRSWHELSSLRTRR